MEMVAAFKNRKLVIFDQQTTSFKNPTDVGKALRSPPIHEMGQRWLLQPNDATQRRFMAACHFCYKFDFLGRVFC